MGEVLITSGMVSIEATALTEAVSLTFVSLSVGAVLGALLYLLLQHTDIEITIELGTNDIVSICDSRT